MPVHMTCRSAPWAIIMAVTSSAVTGFAYLLAITFSIQVGHRVLVLVFCVVQRPGEPHQVLSFSVYVIYKS